ncbi:MAG: hypothetical protein JO265_05810 [Acidimicrobiia bacterium]|nr:hypothetical protein [Acidimicrobiia bacterium]
MDRDSRHLTRSDKLAAVDATAGIEADGPDWPEWLDAVRGRGTGRRLETLGL